MAAASFYHVFLSFRGETRKEFTCFLYEALKAEGFVAFMDKCDIPVGDEVASTIKEGIRNSTSAIIIFSQDYANSKWCLDELVLILQRRQTSKYFIIPIFYDVRIEDIKNPHGNYARALEKHMEKHSANKVVEWRKALEEVGRLRGIHLEGEERSTFIAKIVKNFKEKFAYEFPVCPLSVPERSVSQGSSSSSSSTHELNEIPEDFRCPISLELMVDPVFVSTGQTYERTSIKKWIEAGHDTCPKTQQTLTSFVLTPNYVLRGLIEQWCVANRVEPPRQSSEPRKKTPAPVVRSMIYPLLTELTYGNPEEQRSAAGEISLLTKQNAHNCMAFAEAGAIPLLVDILKTPDLFTQEYAITALLNLFKCEDNKWSILSRGAVAGIVYVLTEGSMKARKRAAATLSSLSVVDENKVTIGSSGAIPPLVTLLTEGNQRGKKDAASALHNLCTYQGNKEKAVRAEIVPTLMKLLKEPDDEMVEKSLAILAALARHSKGRAAIGQENAFPVLVAVLNDSGSLSINKKNAASVLMQIGSADQQHLIGAQKPGVMCPVGDLVQYGTTKVVQDFLEDMRDLPDLWN